MRKGYEQRMRLPSGEETCAEPLVSLSRPSKNHAPNTLGPDGQGVQRRNRPYRRRENQEENVNPNPTVWIFPWGPFHAER